MNRSLRFLLPNRISGQITIIIVASLIVVHLIITGMFLLRAFENQRAERPPTHPGEIEVLMTLLDAAPQADRARLVETLRSSFPDTAIRLESSLPVDWTKAPSGPGLRWFGRRLGPGFEVAFAPHANGDEQQRIAVRLRDGEVVTAQIPRPPQRWRLFDPIVVTLLTIAIVVAVLGIWAARAVTAPLRSFATAAESFSPEGAISLLPERGPREIRAAARALNQMRERIKSLVDDRTRMLVAVGHDLRTPITRLRLSSEFVVDPVLRAQMLRDLDQMKAMVESILVYMREGRSRKNLVNVDVAACVQTVCDSFADTGSDVRLEATESVSVKADPDELLRAVTNVVDNAVRYAGRATVNVTRTPAGATITVADDGPGIPDERKAAMLQPFVRGEPGRNMDRDGGFGLGLSIAAAIVGAGGGKLTLLDGKPKGLTVVIELPVAQGQDAAAKSILIPEPVA